MDAKPSASSPGAADGGQQDEAERYGPLELRRLRKEDGRDLIVYSRAEHAAPTDPEPAGEPDGK